METPGVGLPAAVIQMRLSHGDSAMPLYRIRVKLHDSHAVIDNPARGFSHLQGYWRPRLRLASRQR